MTNTSLEMHHTQVRSLEPRNRLSKVLYYNNTGLFSKIMEIVNIVKGFLEEKLWACLTEKTLVSGFVKAVHCSIPSSAWAGLCYMWYSVGPFKVLFQHQSASPGILEKQIHRPHTDLYSGQIRISRCGPENLYFNFLTWFLDNYN